MNNRFKSVFLIFTFFCFSFGVAKADNVFDSKGRVVNTSEWLQTGTKKKSKIETEPEKEIEEVVEAEKNDDDPAIPEQLSMTEKPVVEGKGFSDKIYSAVEIEASHTQSLSDFFQKQGVLVMTSGGQGSKSEVSFKGFTSFCIKVYIDGIYANNPTTGEFDWNSIDISSIESIRISEIPELGATEFSGCAIYITTKNGKKSVLRAEIAASSYETKAFDGIYQSVNYSSNTKNFFYRVGAITVFADNEFSIEGAKRNLFNFSKQGNFNFSWNAKVTEPVEVTDASRASASEPKISLSGSSLFAYNSLKVFGTGDSLKTGIEEDYTTQHNVAIELKLEKMKLKTTLSYFYGQVDYFENRTPAKDEKTTTNSQSIEIRETMNWIFDATLAYKEEHLFSGKGDRHKIDFGFSKVFALKKDEDGRYKNGKFSITPCVQFVTWGGASAVPEPVEGRSSSESWQFKALPRLTIGIFDFYISGYRIFTLPTFNQLYWKEDAWSAGNPDLKPENGWAVTVGFKRDGFPLFARFTYSYYENKIRWGASGTKMKPLNIGNADYYVGVLGYEQEVWKNHLVLKADFTVTEARLRDTKKQIMWVPEFQAHAALIFRYSFFQFAADYSWTGKRYVSNLNIETYPDFHLLDLSVDFKVNGEFTIYAKATNVLDERVVYHDNYYIPSRKYTVGLRFEK